MAPTSGAARLYLLACRRIAQQPRLAQSQSHFARPVLTSRRTFTTSPARWEDGKDSKPGEEAVPQAESEVQESPKAPPPPPSSEKPVDWRTLAADIEAMEGPQLLDYAAKQQGYNTFDEYIEGHLRRGEGAPVTPATERRLDEDLRKVDQNMIQKMSFWYDPDDPECSTEEHDEFDENDITEMAHAKLEEIREMRHYQRLAVWELPLLSKLAKPFELPSEKQVLRWRYTTYMGDNHPAEKKVVVQFAPDDLGLTPVQADKLKKLAGPRYNPEKELIKMSCESYPHPAQNKRYLSALVDDLIAAAKDPKDNFADIPLDTRHHRVQAKPRFPKEWFMTEERKLELEEGRRQLRQQEIHAIESGQVVDGKRVIESYLVKKAEEEANKQKVEQLVPAGRPGKSSPSARAR